MKKIVTSATIIALTIASGFAQASRKVEPKVAGFYFGGGYGKSKLNFEQIDLSDTKKPQNKTNSASDHAFKILAGYQFEPVLGIEAAFANLHDLKKEKNFYVYSLSSNIGYSFSNGIRPFALLGLGGVHSSFGSDLSLHYGAGLEFAPAILRGLALRTSYEVDMFTNKAEKGFNKKVELSNFTVGLNYKF